MSYAPQPPIPTSLVKSCEKLIASGHSPALVHAGAVAQHAASVGLTNGDARSALRAMSELHESLRPFGAYADELPQSIIDLWSSNHLITDTKQVAWYSYPLGDLYQSISTEARKGRALCQTPYFVGQLLVDVAVGRALRITERPLVIDPSCGTGHLLVESASKLLLKLNHPYWTSQQEQVLSAMSCIHGVDLDQYAALIASYRLLVLAWSRLSHYGGTDQLKDVPINVSSANSLLADNEPILQRSKYHAVVANPPYIVVADSDLREAIRAKYKSVCHGKYSLALPFTVLMTELLVPGGWCAQITTNAWMKREYGAKFVESYLSKLELEYVIDSSGAYIPGHGTPTCILVHRNAPASGKPVFTVMGKRGEPSTPVDPSKGEVWSSIERAVRERESWAKFASYALPEEQPETPAAQSPIRSQSAQVSIFDMLAAEELSA